MQVKLDAWLVKKAALEAMGFHVESVWECEYLAKQHQYLNPIKAPCNVVPYLGNGRPYEQRHLVEDIYHGRLFGLAEVDLTVRKIIFLHEKFCGVTECILDAKILPQKSRTIPRPTADLYQSND